MAEKEIPEALSSLFEAVLAYQDTQEGLARVRSAARICQHHKGMTLRCVCGKDDPAYDICKLMQKEYPMMEIYSK